MKIVGFVGPKGSGKDTTADILEETKRISGRISFAGPLKRIVSEIFGIAPTNLNHPTLKETPFKTPIFLTKKHLRDIKNKCVEILDPYYDEGTLILYNPNKASVDGLEGREIKSPREMLQIIGTNFIRERIFKDWHLHAAFADTTRLSSNGVYAVTDVRFLNEYEFLKNKFGDSFVGYYVERPEAEERLAQATHPSETGVRDIRALLGDSVIKNDGTLKDLKDLVADLKLPEAAKVEKPKKGFKFKKHGE